MEKRQLFARANRILHSDIDLETSSHSGKALWSLQGNRGRRTLCGTHVVLFLRPVAISQSTKFRAPEPKALLLHTATSTEVPSDIFNEFRSNEATSFQNIRREPDLTFFCICESSPILPRILESSFPDFVGDFPTIADRDSRTEFVDARDPRTHRAFRLFNWTQYILSKPASVLFIESSSDSFRSL